MGEGAPEGILRPAVNLTTGLVLRVSTGEPDVRVRLFHDPEVNKALVLLVV